MNRQQLRRLKFILPEWSKQITATLMVLLIGVALTLTASFNTEKLLESNFLKEFEWVSESRVRVLDMELHKLFSGIQMYGALVQAGSTGDKNDIANIRASMLFNYPYIERILLFSYQPGNEDLQLVSPASDTMDAYLTPQTVDWWSHPFFGSLFRKALQTAHMVAGRQFQLGDKLGKNRFPLVVTVPHDPSNKSPSPPVTGLVVAIINIDQLVSDSIGLMEPRGVDVVIHDDSSASKGNNIEVYTSRLASYRKDSYSSDTLDVAL